MVDYYYKDKFGTFLVSRPYYDFDDGNGLVPAHRHPNGEGWVANTARVDHDSYVGPDARVFGEAKVVGKSVISDCAQVRGASLVSDRSMVVDNAIVSGSEIRQRSLIEEHSQIYDAIITGKSTISGNSILKNCWHKGDAKDFIHTGEYPLERTLFEDERFGVTQTIRVDVDTEIRDDGTVDPFKSVQNWSFCKSSEPSENPLQWELVPRSDHTKRNQVFLEVLSTLSSTDEAVPIEDFIEMANQTTDEIMDIIYG